MEFRTFLFIILTVPACAMHAQNRAVIENEDRLFWQPEASIDYSHFQSESDADCIKYNEQYGLTMSANIQLLGIVDIPKAHRSKNFRKRTGFDKVYLSPVFCKECSCMLSEDSTELAVYRLLFDVAEMSARGIRKELLEMQNEENINNANTVYFKTVKNKWDERMRTIWASIYQDVLIQKKEGEYASWRKLADEVLEEYKDFSTQPSDVQRLILGKPIEEDYVQAPSIMGDLNTDNEK